MRTHLLDHPWSDVFQKKCITQRYGGIEGGETFSRVNDAFRGCARSSFGTLTLVHYNTRLALHTILVGDGGIHITKTRPSGAGFFWHVSDFHFDKDYTTHGVREAMCHSTPNQLSSDDIGPYGDFKCDAPRPLVESAVAAMRRIEPDPDFVLWTGSVPFRARWPDAPVWCLERVFGRSVCSVPSRS